MINAGKAGRDRNISFIGPPKSGKTYAMCETRYYRLHTVYIDITDDLATLPPGFTAVGAETAAFLEACATGGAFSAASIKGYSCHFTLHAGSLIDNPKELLRVCKLATNAAAEAPGRWTFYLDEVGALVQHGHKKLVEHFAAVARLGRQKGVSVCTGTHRPQEMPPPFRAVTEETWLTGCGNYADYEFVRRNMGGPELVEAVRQVSAYRAAAKTAGRPEYPFVRKLHSGENKWRRKEGEPEWLVSSDGDWCVTEQVGGGRLGRKQ
jgi:hypothetical protein